MEDITIQNYSLDSLNDTLDDDDGFDGTVSDFQYYVEGVGIIVTASIGLIINIFALYILMKKHVSTSYFSLWKNVGIFLKVFYDTTKVPIDWCIKFASLQ